MSGYTTPAAIPAQTGIGLRHPHIHPFLATLPDIGWVEVHSENYFADGGQALHLLERVRQHYPVSLHGVGLSLGSSDTLDKQHLAHLKTFIKRIEPGFVSDHVSWSSINGRYFNDLLPLPYTDEALSLICRHIDQTQDYLGCQILVENISSYMQYHHSTMREWEFLTLVAQHTGCGILLDVNNIYVSSMNHGWDASEYLQNIPMNLVNEFHLAGYTTTATGLLDTHNTLVSAPVWTLYSEALMRFGQLPTLLEWDSDLPPLETLLKEADKAARLMEEALDASVT